MNCDNKTATPQRRILAAILIYASIILAGCSSQHNARLNNAREAYRQRQYAVAYRDALLAMHSNSIKLRHEAAYLVGASAHQLKDPINTERYLLIAASSHDEALAGDAMIMLGLSYAGQGRHEHVVRTLLDAAPRLTGQDKANAYFHAAKAQQKLGRWASARTNLSLALSGSQNTAFRERISQELNVTGFTLQAGAFTGKANARAIAEDILIRTTHANLGTPRLIPAVDARGRSLYLVQIGQFSSYTTALAARQLLRPTVAIVVPLTTGQ